MTERKPFLLRIDAGLYATLARWADDETRSLNGQIEALLRRAVEADGRFPASASRQPAERVHPRRLPAPLGRQPRAASREPVPQPSGRGRIPRRPSSPGSMPKVVDRAPGRRPKPAAPPTAPAPSTTPQPVALQPAEPQPAAARPSQMVPADSWDAMED